MYKKICYVSTIYSLLLYLLLKSEKDTFFILGEELPEHFKKSFLLPNVAFKKEIIRGISKPKKYYLKLKRNIKLKLNLRKVDKNAVVYGYHMSDWVANTLKEKYRYYILEDGLANYNIKEKDIRKKRFNLKEFLFLGARYNYPSYGIDKETKKIFLTGLEEIPEIIEKKVKIIDLKKLWNDKSEDEKDKILNIFKIKLLDIEEVEGNNKILLITQPLSEDKIIEEKEKLEIYKEIIEKYGDENVVIKKHPREKTNYEKIFPKVKILPNEFPLELFSLLDFKIKKVVTLFSTSAYSFKGKCEIDFIGTRGYKKIVEKFGIIEMS